jgi:hypothetical protein
MPQPNPQPPEYPKPLLARSPAGVSGFAHGSERSASAGLCRRDGGHRQGIVADILDGDLQRRRARPARRCVQPYTHLTSRARDLPRRSQHASACGMLSTCNVRHNLDRGRLAGSCQGELCILHVAWRYNSCGTWPSMRRSRTMCRGPRAASGAARGRAGRAVHRELDCEGPLASATPQTLRCQAGANRGAGRVGRRRKVFSAVRGWSKQGCLSCTHACVMLCCAQTIERREEIAVLLRDANRLRTPAPSSSIGYPAFLRHAPSACTASAALSLTSARHVARCP